MAVHIGGRWGGGETLDIFLWKKDLDLREEEVENSPT